MLLPLKLVRCAPCVSAPITPRKTLRRRHSPRRAPRLLPGRPAGRAGSAPLSRRLPARALLPGPGRGAPQPGTASPQRAPGAREGRHEGPSRRRVPVDLPGRRGAPEPRTCSSVLLRAGAKSALPCTLLSSEGTLRARRAAVHLAPHQPAAGCRPGKSGSQRSGMGRDARGAAEAPPP